MTPFNKSYMTIIMFNSNYGCLAPFLKYDFVNTEALKSGSLNIKTGTIP